MPQLNCISKLFLQNHSCLASGWQGPAIKWHSTYLFKTSDLCNGPLQGKLLHIVYTM
jgi:hypothetical protein